MEPASRKNAWVALAAAFVFAAGGCAGRDNVSVVDAVTRKPVVGAKVMTLYPSFNGAIYETNSRGVAHIGGFGIPRHGYGIEVTAPGYEKLFFKTYATSEDNPGWEGDNLDVELMPTTRP